MATVRMFGQTFAVDLIQKLGLDLKGRQLWQAVSRAHTARTVPGTTITVSQSEILEAAAAELPPDNGSAASPSAPPSASEVAASQAQLEAGMATERENLPTAAQLLQQHRSNKATGVSVSPGPTQRPAGRPKSQELRP